MRRLALALSLLALAPFGHAQTIAPATGNTFAINGDHFELDGKPFRILAGEMHYPRIPRAQWRDRMKKAKAMGLNTLTTYVFWDVHEPRPGHFDFTGNNDLAEYLRIAQEEGLYVILRPGPYVCAEWDFGGYPAWLMKDPTTVVRSLDPKFMQPTTRWFHRLGEVIKPLLLANGGPIIAVQVENEYGSFGKDHEYMEAMHQLVLASGMGGDAAHPELLYTADGGVQLPNGTLPNVAAVVNFGPGASKGEIARLQRFRPGAPTMVGEYWAGWFDHWGRTHNPTNAKQQVDEFTSIISQGYSINLYMLHGGTSFGWMAGANSNGPRNYEPDVTNYDYDAPIDERGNPTPKYFALRDAIAKATGVTPPPVPTEVATTVYPIVATRHSASLWKNLPKPVLSEQPLTMEQLDQSYGYILYTKQLTAAQSGTLALDKLHDVAFVYLDHALIGTLDRRLNQSTLDLPAATKPRELEILVEGLGRINYGIQLRDDRKGISGGVTLAATPLTGWSIYSLPFKHPEQLKFSAAPCTGPCFFTTTLTASGLDPLQDDTFLDTTAIHNGFVWLNNKPLGRAWNVGPQAALLVPGSWLKKGVNRLVVLDLQADKTPNLLTTEHTIWIPGANEPPPRPRPVRPATPPAQPATPPAATAPPAP